MFRNNPERRLLQILQGENVGDVAKAAMKGMTDQGQVLAVRADADARLRQAAGNRWAGFLPDQVAALDAIALQIFPALDEQIPAVRGHARVFAGKVKLYDRFA